MIVDREAMVRNSEISRPESIRSPAGSSSGDPPASGAGGSAGIMAAAAAAAAAAHNPPAFAFPFANLSGLSGLNGLRMIPNGSAFHGMLHSIRPNLATLAALPFALHPSALHGRPPYVFPYAHPHASALYPSPGGGGNPPQPPQPPQAPSARPPPPQQQPIQQIQAGRPEERNPCGLPQTPPTSPSLDENLDHNKNNGQFWQQVLS